MAANRPAGAARSSPKSPQAGAWHGLRPVNLLATVVVRIVPKTIFRAEPSSASLPLTSGHSTDPAEGASPFLAPAVRVPGPWFSPRSAHGRRMMGLRGCWPSNVVHAVCEQAQPDQRNGRTHVPAGTSRRIRRTDANRWTDQITTVGRAAGTMMSRRCSESRSRLEHRVHDHRKLARDRDCRALEANLRL